jgi:hypothetical protein
MSCTGTSNNRSALASWLSPELLVVLVSADAPDDARGVPVLAEHDGRKARARWLMVAPGDGTGNPTWLVTAVPTRTDTRIIGRLLMGPDGGRALTMVPVESVLCEPAEFARHIRAQAGGATRGRVQAFLACAPREFRMALDTALASSLAAIRSELRERVPERATTPEAFAGALETVTALDSQSFSLTGRLPRAQAHDLSLVAISPEGSRSEIKPAALVLLADSDGDRDSLSVRFHALVKLDSPSSHPTGWVLELRSPSGVTELDAEKPLLSDNADVRGTIAVLRSEGLAESAFEEFVLGTLSRLRAPEAEPRVQSVTDYGSVPVAPEASIVVAVGDVDRVQLQLGEFARDSELGEPELVFVVCPAGSSETRTSMAELHDLYGIPFRLVELSRPAAPTRALNLGGAIARGRRLLLMRGDAVPRNPGWFRALLEFKGRSCAIGAVVPKLLYADDTIASAGLEFRHGENAREWDQESPFAGLPRVTRRANVPRRVQASSEACLLVDAADFDRCGGFGELYVSSADEGADLYLRLGSAGLETWYVPDAELYVLDRPASAANPPRDPGSFDDWLFNRRWAELLAAEAPEGRNEAVAQPSTPRSPPIEYLHLTAADGHPEWVRDAGLALPSVDPSRGLYEGTYSFVVDGWVRSRDGSQVVIEATADGVLLAQASANAELEDTDRAPWAEGSGFRLVLGSLRLPPEFKVAFEAVHPSGQRARLGFATGRRRRIVSPSSPAFRPVMVTTLGRTGSNWLLALFNQHPEIVVFRPFQYEAVLASYWAEVLRALSEPSSYMQIVLPQVDDGDWWLRCAPDRRLPIAKPGPEMARWLGHENVESLARFVRDRVDGFYVELTRDQGKTAATCFAEKSTLTRARSIAELYPDGREIVLVRDFRDRMSSILAYNAQRGLQLWGHDSTTSDEEWFAHLRRQAIALLAYWQREKHRVHLVRYEDLIREPEPTLAGAFSYIGIEDGPELVRRTIEEASSTLRHGQEFHRTTPSAEASIGRWKRDLTPERRAACAAAFDDVLAEFGYSPTDDLALAAPGSRFSQTRS